MRTSTGFTLTSLRVKLVLSYLAVALGATLALAIAVALAIQNFVYQNDLQLLRSQAFNDARQLSQYYSIAGNWNGIEAHIPPDDPSLLAITDHTGTLVLCGVPLDVKPGCNNPTILTALHNALKGSEIDGSIIVSTNDHTFRSLYVSIPINNGPGGPVIGALFLSLPLNSEGLTQVLAQVNAAILLAGLAVALLVILFSFFFARRLTRPLEALTRAAEQMKQGNYAQRVPLPATQDEMGQLALTFNAMADTIAADIAELRRQDQVRRELIANIAHDLATPLTAIQGLSEAMADDMIVDPAARQETAQRIGREVQRLRRLVADMQNMTLLESGQVRLDLAPLDLNSLVDETLLVIEPECEQAGITLHNDIAPDTPHVMADSDRITQVLLNLLDNARRHTPCGGQIRIGAMCKDQVLVVTVSDTGSGIDPKDLPHIFERFYRADRSRTGATGGSGLGLSIVKAIISAHGGRVWAESTPGQGTKISFTLPIAGKA
jgi:two-component system sensor histidine kinase BaeS